MISSAYDTAIKQSQNFKKLIKAPNIFTEGSKQNGFVDNTPS